MNLAKRNIALVFLQCLLLTLSSPIFIPSLKLQYFIPFLVILYYKKPLLVCLWTALFCGLILDALSPHSLMGLHAGLYTLTTAVLYPQKRHFFADSASTLPLMAFLFSFISTLVNAFIVGVLPLDKLWVIADLFFLPACDAALSFSVFILPFLIFGKRIRRGEEYFTEAV